MPVVSAKHLDADRVHLILFYFIYILIFWEITHARRAMQTSPSCDSALYIDRKLHIPTMQFQRICCRQEQVPALLRLLCTLRTAAWLSLQQQPILTCTSLCLDVCTCLDVGGAGQACQV